MKTAYYLTGIVLLCTLSCKAQNPIVSLDAYNHRTADGAYFKDLNNEFDKFEGTWIYTNGNTIFTIVIEKRERRSKKKIPLEILRSCQVNS